MGRNILTVVAALVVVLGLIGYSAAYTVHEAEQVLVLQLGDPKRVINPPGDPSPGLHFKLPFVQNIVAMDKRVLDFDAPKEEVIASDKKRIVVDAYARYQITNPLLFYTTVNNEAMARQRLAAIINSSLRRVLAQVELQSILSGERSMLIRQISDAVNSEARKIGLEILDVRIKRADLPEENSQAVYRRMEAERERDAREARARGAEEAQKIRADADRQKIVLLAEANKQSEILRGEGDAMRNRIFARVFGADPEFFTFYRSLQAYRNALKAEDTTLVLSPNSDFFRYFGDILGRERRPAGAGN